MWLSQSWGLALPGQRKSCLEGGGTAGRRAPGLVWQVGGERLGGLPQGPPPRHWHSPLDTTQRPLLTRLPVSRPSPPCTACRCPSFQPPHTHTHTHSGIGAHPPPLPRGGGGSKKGEPHAWGTIKAFAETHVPWGSCPPPGLVLLVLDGPWVAWVGCALLMALGRWPLGTQAVSLSPALCGWPAVSCHHWYP